MLPEKNLHFLILNLDIGLFLDGQRVVGRVAGYVNRRDNKLRAREASRFGSIDFVDDLSVCRLLLDQVENWSRDLGMTQIDGPMGPGHFDRNCILIDGFEELPTVISSYNYPYYSNYLEECGYHKDVDYLEHRIRISEEPDKRIEKFHPMSLKRKTLSLECFL